MIKFRSVLGRYEASELDQIDAAALLGITERTFRRWCVRFEDGGEAGLLDRRLGQASGRRVPTEQEQQIETLYRTRYSGFTAKHFHEHLVRDHGFSWGYTWTKVFLQSKGLVSRAKTRGAHRRKRPRRPLPGMMLHQDGSRHEWIAGLETMDLIVTMDDATNTIYSGFLVPEEGTASTFQALLEVFGEHGLPLSLYTDRGSHYFYTQVSDPGWPGAGAAGGGAHCGLFTPGPRTVGASVWNPAGPAGEGAGVGGDRHGCSRQRVYP
jgi:transposase